MPNIKKIALKVAKEMRDKSEYDVLDLVCNAEPFAEALVAELTKQRDLAVEYLKRYRSEVPAGNQPHMICHLVDKFLSTIK